MAEAPSVRCPSACLLFAMILFVAGCQDSDKITVYTIPKEKNVPSETDPFGAMPNDAVHSRVRPAPSSATPFDHMLAAFVRNGDRTWFFKLAGPKEAVNNQVQSFKSFARSVRFGEDGNPHWTLPEGWHEEPGNSVRYATLRIGSATPPLEVTVTPLPHFEQSEQDYALANVNRWRTQQMGLAAIKRLDEKDSGVETTDVDGKTMYLVDLGSPNEAGSDQPSTNKHKSAAPAPSASPPTQKTQSAELSKSPAPDDDASSDKTGNQNEQDKSADDSSAGSEEKLNRQNAQPEEQDAKPAEDTVTPDEQTAPSGADDSEKSQGAPAPNGETSSSTRSSSDSSSTEQFGHAPLTEGPHDDKTHTSTVSHHGSVAIGGGTC